MEFQQKKKQKQDPWTKGFTAGAFQLFRLLNRVAMEIER